VPGQRSKTNQAICQHEERSRQLSAVIRRPLEIKRQEMDKDPAYQCRLSEDQTTK
jgi:hypothetical protein